MTTRPSTMACAASYILREFRSVFSNKPHADYRLSHSFRFGPVTQCAHNVITFNALALRSCSSHTGGQPAQIHIITADEKDAIDINKQLTRDRDAVTKKGVKPNLSRSSCECMLKRAASRLNSCEQEYHIGSLAAAILRTARSKRCCTIFSWLRH